MPTRENLGLGWRLFFGTLLLLQTLALTIVWRTYDAIQDVSQLATRNELIIREVIIPRLTEQEKKIESISRALNRPGIPPL